MVKPTFSPLSSRKRHVPGGTTEQAIKSFEENGIRELFDTALYAAVNRSRELSRNSGQVSLLGLIQRWWGSISRFPHT